MPILLKTAVSFNFCGNVVFCVILSLMLKVSNINKSYGDIRVLKDVSLAVDSGEVVAVTGPSGAGKTTLLQIMGTLDYPDSGTVSFNGVEVTALADRELSRFRNRKIGFVFQSHQLLPEFTLLENVMMPALIGGTSSKKARERALTLLADVGLSHRVDHKPSQLSGGENQRGAVARALTNNPQVIFADEPTGNLDSATSAELRDLFFKIRDKYGSTFVIVTHDESLARRCDRTILIIDGVVSNRN